MVQTLVDSLIGTTFTRALASLGFARYPSRATRDWEPVNYGCIGGEDNPYESSSDELSRDRKHYATVFENLAYRITVRAIT